MDDITTTSWPTIAAQLADAIAYAEAHGLSVFTVAAGGHDGERIVVNTPTSRPTRADIAATGIEWTIRTLSAPYLHLTAPTPGGVFRLILLTDDPDIKAGLGLADGADLVGSVLAVS
jgi:hypothetical protein